MRTPQTETEYMSAIVDAGLITPGQDGPNKMKRYSRVKLMALAKASHYSTK
jgi:hypothetical protein